VNCYSDHYRKENYRSGYTDGYTDGRRRSSGLRRSRSGVLLGVCQGIANWMGIAAWPIRLVTLIAFLASEFFPVGALYLLAALIMQPEER
jgi:phage shock protein C